MLKMISLVDDDVELLKALTKILEKEGYQVIPNADAQTALDQIRKNPLEYKLVITDISMPGMKGTELLITMKKEFPNIPVIIMTAFGDWGQYMQAMGDGAFEFINKPIEKAEFLKTVQRAISRNLNVSQSQRNEEKNTI